MKKNRGVKKFVALLIASLMAVVSPLSCMTVYADPSELDAVALPLNGGGTTTAYLWKTDSRAGNIDFEGILDASRIGLDEPYSGDNDNSVRTTFGRYGYSTVIASSRVTSGATAVRIPTNGGVLEFSNLGVEVQIKAYPSPDKKWILVDYIIYNKRGTINTVHIASGTDVQVGQGSGSGAGDPADGSKLTADERGFHMVNRDTQETFDLITNDAELGVTTPDTRWVGDYSGGNWTRNYFTNGPFQCENIDSALTYSWEVVLQPYDTQLRRVAFGARGPSYYVSAQHGAAGNRGTYDSPFQTIQQALDKLGNDMGYIYIQDYGEFTSPITISNNVTFMSADYDTSGTPVYDIITLKRAASFTTDPLFQTSGSGTVQFSNIILDGNKDAIVSNNYPLVKATSGGVVIQTGAILQNNRVTDINTGSAIDITATADLTMNFGTITDNISAEKGAVYFDSSGDFEIMNDIDVIDNTLSDGVTPRNVYLGSGRTIDITGILTGDIGITTADLPEPTEAGSTSTDPAHQVKIVEWKNEDSVDNPSFYTDQFKSDAPAETGLRITSSGKDIVFRLDGVEMEIEYVDEDGIIIHPTDNKFLAIGAVVEVSPEPLTGYEIKTTTISPSTVTGLVIEPSGPDKGKVTGIMPNQMVTITFEYQRGGSSIYFYANGGTPEPEPLIGEAGAPVNAIMPGVTKLGYDFAGWYIDPSFAGMPEDNLPSFFATTPISYYAKWVPNNLVFFNYTVRYINTDGSITFQAITSSDKNVENPINAEMKNVPSYKLRTTSVTPASFDNSPVGSFDNITKDFSGTMPNQATIVTYTYEVDYSDLANRNKVTVIHQALSGTVLNTEEFYYFPEDNITISPLGLYGYNPLSWSVTKGTQEDETTMITALTGSFNQTGVYTGVMPNQEVEIVYSYESTGEGFDFIVRYQCDGEDIIEPERRQLPADEDARVTFKNIYGYAYNNAEANPAIGTFDPITHDYSATMPSDTLTVTYHYDKDLSKWAVLTYEADADGVLSDMGASEKLRPGLISGTYEADIIINDGTAEGQAGCYTWAEILERKLAPTPEANQYYQFKDWYIDTNTNGTIDDGEALTTDYRFTGTETVRASFEEDPQWWIDIFFEAGEHGSMLAGEITTYHLVKTTTWAELTPILPAFEPEVNYLLDGWYEGDHRMEAADIPEHQHTYTFRFKEDPAVFGTDLTAPDARGSVDAGGSGRLTVYSTLGDYRYVVTDLDGKILGIEEGSDLNNRTVFTGLSPGSRYLVYEADDSFTKNIGDNIAGAAGLSPSTEVLIPVIETNYYISYDEEQEGKTRLVITPADSNTDYAVLDKNGVVVITSETNSGGWQRPKGSNPAKVEFSGLDYDDEYIVVGRSKEKTTILAGSKVADGTTIVTDPGGEFEIPSFIIETINGVIVEVSEEAVGGNRFDEAQAGDFVEIFAPERDSSGNKFLYWKVLVGNISGFPARNTRQTVTFTMPATNVVLAAFYDTSNNGLANVEDEVNGGKEGEIALDPEDIPNLEETLTTNDDKTLIDKNNADVTYKVVFDKNRVRNNEAEAIKASTDYNQDHIKSFKGAWGLDIRIERYVNGRKIGLATASNVSFNAIVQLNKEDIDMMDYQLYQIEDDGMGGFQVTLMTLDADPETTGGLFRFEAFANCRYVLVYSKADRVTFLNEIGSKEFPVFPPVYRYTFKVRRYEAVTDSYYSDEFNQIQEPVAMLIDNDGIQHDYVGWSTKDMPERYREFDFNQGITKRMIIYAYYNNNYPQLMDKRDELEQAIKDAEKLSKEYFLKQAEVDEMIEAIADAKEVFDQLDRKATYEELKEALRNLKRIFDRIKEKLEEYQKEYDDKNNNSQGKGGLGSGGGSGKGVVQNPFNPKPQNTYHVGTNGYWELVDSENNKWSFFLNGGIALRQMWAWLEYTEGDTSRTGWYRFDNSGIMNDGWFRDEDLNWYYLNKIHDGWFGKMKTGWHSDSNDGYRYYLDSETGAMVTGWKFIDGQWYYFTTSNSQNTYRYDENARQWLFIGVDERPVGSLYQSGRTPDGYLVDANGRWIE